MDQSVRHYIVSISDLRFKNFLVKTRKGPMRVLRLVANYLIRNPEEQNGNKPKPISIDKLKFHSIISVIDSEEENLDEDKVYDIYSEGVYAGKYSISSLTNLTKISEE